MKNNMYEDIAKEILEILKLEIGKDINEYATHNIAMLIDTRVNSKLQELKIKPEIADIKNKIKIILENLKDKPTIFLCKDNSLNNELYNLYLDCGGKQSDNI